MTKQNDLQIKFNTLDIQRNDDGSFSLTWDPKDPDWSWLNDLTSEQIGIIVEQALDDYLEENELQ